MNTTDAAGGTGLDDRIRLRLDLAYVGDEFHGWQIQPDARTVQGVLRDCLTRLLGRPVTPVGAGRTDAGVHARGQVAHVTVRDEDEVERIERALARMCDADLEITGIRRVSPHFHARFKATARRYSYHLQTRRDIFRPHAWYVYRPLDRAAMDAGARDFVGAHDFSSFCKSASLKDDGNVCEVGLCAFEWSADSAIFHVKANRFLHHMVRNMVGTLVEIGRGERGPGDVPGALAARDRRAVGRMAPARGLFLEEVDYPAHTLDPGWRDPDAPPAADDGPDRPAPRSES